MIVPSMYDLPKVMAESSYNEEQVFDLGIGGEILFLVVVPLIGACRVPVDALSHFMAGADDYTADGMPEHYTGALSGPWKIKRDRLRILPESWEQYSDKAFEMVDVQERADHSTQPPPTGSYRLREAAHAIAKQFGWPDDATDTLISQWVNHAHDGSLTVRHPNTSLPCLPDTSGVYGEFLTPGDVNVWAEKTGVLWRWSVEVAPAQTAATLAPVVAVGISDGVEPDKAGPLPLTTGDIAFCFAGLRCKTEEEWKTLIGKGRGWIEQCLVQPGTRGRGGAPKLWNPVFIGAALVRDGHAKPNSIRAKFQTVHLLQPWRDAWKTYEADNFETE